MTAPFWRTQPIVLILHRRERFSFLCFPIRCGIFLFLLARKPLHKRIGGRQLLRIFRTAILKYRTLVKPSVVRNGSVWLHIHPIIPADVVRRIYKVGYEQGEVALLKETLRRGDRVLDLGAGVGMSAILSAKCTGEKVYAVEANPALIPVIKENAKLNKIEIELISWRGCAFGRGCRVSCGRVFLGILVDAF